MKKILIFTATYNEFKNIKILLKKIENLNINLDILVVDHNSKDGTKEFLKICKKNKKNFFLINRSKKLGLNTAHQIAFNFANRNKYSFLITMDADLSHNPDLIPVFLRELKKNKFVIGSRYTKGGRSEMKLFRRFLSIFGNKLIKYVLKINSNEFTTSYRGFSIDYMKKIEFSEIRSKGYSFFMETIFLINKSKINIKEIPIYFKDRSYGKSKIPKIEIFRTLFNLIRLKFFYKD